MPNVQKAFGLMPSRHLSGGEVRFGEGYRIASGYNTAIYSGDVVIAVNDGTIAKAAATDMAILGVFKGCKFVDARGELRFEKYWPANEVATEIEAFVYDDPNIIFRIATDATGVTAADIHAMANLEVVAGDPTIGISKTVLDVSGGLAATGRQMRILAIVNDGGYNQPGPYAEVEVMFAAHALGRVVAAVGGA